jgi:glycosyltransferase involved in cell wall biosynthesis
VDGVYDLGLVSDEEKEALLTGCKALFQPSTNESYSRVIMEAWGHGRPVAAQRRCLATSMAVAASDGGWLADGIEEWSKLFRTVEMAGESDLAELGRRGKAYAGQYADWDTVIERYEAILELHSASNANRQEIVVQRGSNTQAIHQLTPGFAYGDAISNQAMLVRDLLRKKGYRSEIFTEHLDPSMTHEARLFLGGEALGKEDGIIYHHSIGAGLTDFVIQHQGPKGLVYHNVTPPDLVREHEPELAKILEKGLDDLQVLAPHFPVNVADSQFNCNDLEANGFQKPTVLPICIMPEKWNIPADPVMMAKLQDGKDNILFVGRLVANKCQHDLIKAFAAYHAIYGNSRLILVGGYIEEEKYYQSLQQSVARHRLGGDVLFCGKIPDSVLHACYRCSHLFWSMSEHEGFGVPLIESMWFDLPVFAYKCTAVPETIASGGLLFTSKDDLLQLAVTARLLLHDPVLREKMIAAQHRRREDFLPENIEPKLDAIVQRMLSR